MLAAIRDALPSARRLARQLGLVLGVGVLVGTFLFHVWTGLGQLPGRWRALAWNVYYSLVYTAIIFASVRVAIYVLQARVPLRSRCDVALHAGVLSVVTVGAYGLATAFCWAVHPAFSVRWQVLVVTAAVAFGGTLVWSAFTYMRALYQRLREAEAARYEARLAALRAQINPHFLFNAFNSIATLVRTRPGEAESVVENLSDLFRYALRASKDDAATLGQEVGASRRYLSVEQARFRDRLTARIDVPTSLRSVPVPSMTLQPLVENAVEHGVGETQDDCTVAVKAMQDGNRLVLRVVDTGPGFDTTDLEAVLDKGTGLANVRERLRIFFREEAVMSLRPQGVELRLPIREKTSGKRNSPQNGAPLRPLSGGRMTGPPSSASFEIDSPE
ncbi:sensor histidine kinase [Salinibacter altiplanensis]|uniref:sensor histidine kinase n=1 Tax=Salinibacter altiplanensis TaxID=1803181 RepID=UPI000C9FF432|nr:histidine kinase [Salinibacter altiplanensis]